MHQFTLLSAFILHLSSQCNNYGTSNIKKNNCIALQISIVQASMSDKVQQQNFYGKMK